jgi:hypothetical protein
MKITSLFVAVLACTLIPAGYAQQAPTKPKRIRVSVAVESEGPQGEWAQSAQGLVDWNDPKSHIHVAVVAAQVEHQGASHWVIVSSVLTMADEKGSDLLVTHDVIAGPDLLSVAHTVGFQVASAVLRLLTGTK